MKFWITYGGAGATGSARRTRARTAVQDLELRHDLYAAAPLPQDDRIALYDQAIDDLELAREQCRLLAGELQHRSRNLIATVEAFVINTLKTAQTTDLAIGRISERLAAFSATHALLVRGQAETITLHEVIQGAFAAQVQDLRRVKMDGPQVFPVETSLIGFGLVLHELVTNAVRFGALSVPTGSVRTVWCVHGLRLDFAWEEHDGPAVLPSPKRGFGSELIERALHGNERILALQYLPKGVRWEFSTPLAGFANTTPFPPMFPDTRS